ncbi:MULTISPECIES: hypothetical protein [Arthrobacter]|nr:MULTISPECIES: hypothetical protein [Arthrobacter]MBT8161440.1 hypothetical protein [Arthrobacter sp. GN70]
MLLSTAVYTAMLAFTLVWYDWRLFVLMIAFGWAMNLENTAEQLRRLGQ